MSARAAGMAPSKLGVKAGKSITVETAIRALVVKSANDVAAAVAENIEGSEKDFARRMTRTARSIGMSRTTFANASGLPNPTQVTTARDMATLGLRLMRDFPQYYPYFRTRSFVYQGRTITGHNRLLASYDGTDGIKTGYINASGFNLVSSVRRGDKRLVGVVMGGRTGASRDAYMKKMLTQHFGKARGGKTIAAIAGSSRGAIAANETGDAPAKAEKKDRKAAAAKRLNKKPHGSCRADGARARGTGRHAGRPGGTRRPGLGRSCAPSRRSRSRPPPAPVPRAGAEAPTSAEAPFQEKTPAEQLADKAAGRLDLARPRCRLGHQSRRLRHQERCAGHPPEAAPAHARAGGRQDGTDGDGGKGRGRHLPCPLHRLRQDIGGHRLQGHPRRARRPASLRARPEAGIPWPR